MARPRRAQTPLNMLGAHVRWAVCWVGYKKVKVKLKKGGHAIRKKPVIVEKDCGHDLNEAMRIYDLARSAGKPLATLVCKNVAFPPPEKYLDYIVTKTRVVKKGRRQVKEKYEVWRRPMKKMNNRGIWWCPYCRKMRRFSKQDGFRAEGQYVQQAGYHCQVCSISHRDAHVRKYNPIARRIHMELG